jgi:hypothetical protein
MVKKQRFLSPKGCFRPRRGVCFPSSLFEGRKSPRRGRQKVGELKRRETKQCNFFLLFAFPKGDFFPEGNKLPFGDFFVLLWFRLPLAKSRDKEKKGNKKKEEIIIFSFRKKICLLFRSPLVSFASGKK